MNISIRNEEPRDFRRVEEVAREAFWNLYVPGCSEHAAIHKLRQSPDFLPELTFVIEADREIIGSIFFSRSKIVSPDGTEHPTVTFGPVSIHPRLHRQGLGRQLITHAIAKAAAQGHRAILTLGYPYHYEPYGFTGGKRFGISMPDGKFYKGLLVLPLYEGALDGISGHAVFSDGLEPTAEETEEYDKTFPPKERKFQESQTEFERAVSLLDED